LKTELLYIDSSTYRPDQLTPALDILAAGGLVAFPTETVYGVGAAHGSEKALERLRSLKGRPDDPFTLHIATREQLDAAEVTVSDLARRLIMRFWPGPLTLVLPTTDDGTLGLRLPANPLATDLIRQSGPLWVPSANPQGAEPARTGAEVKAYFDGQVEMVIDCGPTTLGQSSTVVRVEQDGCEILRQGAVPQAELERLILVLVLLVCTGNTCRSPLGEVLMAKALAERLDVPLEGLREAGYLVESAGTMASNGAPASGHSVTVAHERGCDLDRHSSQSVTIDRMLEADLILTMSRGHLQSLVAMVPELQDRIVPLDAGGLDISDPIGGSLEDYRSVATQIQRGVDAAIERYGLI